MIMAKNGLVAQKVIIFQVIGGQINKLLRKGTGVNFYKLKRWICKSQKKSIGCRIKLNFPTIAGTGKSSSLREWQEWLCLPLISPARYPLSHSLPNVYTDLTAIGFIDNPFAASYGPCLISYVELGFSNLTKLSSKIISN